MNIVGLVTQVVSNLMKISHFGTNYPCPLSTKVTAIHKH